MGRPKATYGRKGAIRQTFHADCFDSSSSPLKSSDAGPEPPAQLPSPRIKNSKARIVAYEESGPGIEQSDISTVKNVQGHRHTEYLGDEESLPDSPAKNTRNRKALQVRDANAVVDQYRLRSKSQQPLSKRQDNLLIPAPWEATERTISTTFNDITATVQAESKSPYENRDSQNEKKQQEQDANSSSTSDPPQASTSSTPDEFSTHAESLLALSSDSKLTPFADYAEALSAHFGITKLAEASYGEVYRLSLLPSTTTQLRNSFSRTDESVLKLIALKPPSAPPPSSKLTIDGKKRRRKQWNRTEQQRIESMSRVEDVTSEVRLLKHMSCVPGFTNFRALTVLRGPMPSSFSSAWHDYNNNVKESEFPDPSSVGAYFGNDQLWAVIEMQDAGRDLEAIILKSVWSIWDAFWSITIAMAKGEEWARYEHRDLHLGNVCVKWNETGTMDPTDINAAPVNLKRLLAFTNLETTIIDYTLSRADMNARAAEQHRSPSNKFPAKIGAQGSDIQPVDDVAFLDLSLDLSLFEGDAEVEYQYEIYRCMRFAALFGNPLASKSDIKALKFSKNKKDYAGGSLNESAAWRQSHPLTNLIWLHFVLFKLCEGVEIWPSNDKRLYSSKSVQKHAVAIEEKLSLLSSILELENLNRGAGGDPEGLMSCADLVAWAVQEGWLGEDDVTTCGLGKGKDEETLLELVENLAISDKEDIDFGNAKALPNERGRRKGRRKELQASEPAGEHDS